MTPGQRGVLVCSAALGVALLGGFASVELGLENPWPGMGAAFIVSLIVFGFMTAGK